jgi:uncharacterized membrane protein YoaK (UPF0700 family)
MPAGSRAPAVDTPAKLSRLEALLVVLTFAAGVVDAVSFLGLGQIFTANMTGNVVFLALAVGERNLETALRSTAALIGFSVGAIAAGRVLVTPRPSGAWPRQVNWLMWGELALLVTFAAVWVSALGVPGSGVLYLLIALSSIAMGLQNAAARHLAVPGLTTTVITTALTGLMVELPALGIAGSPQRRAVWAVAALFSGAAVGATLVVYARPFAPVLTVGVVAGVAVAAHSWFRGSPSVDT